MWTLQTQGAPLDQGIAQGRAAETLIRRRLRSAHGPRSGRPERLELERFLPQLAERERGIALGAGLSRRSLARAARASLPALAAQARGTRIFAHLESNQLDRLWFRRSLPDHVTLPSLELSLPWLAGCIAGVNSDGVAVAVLEEAESPDIACSILAQDLLARASSTASAVEHLGRRLLYCGSVGRILLTDAGGDARRLRLEGRQLRVAPALPAGPSSQGLGLEVDAAARSVSFAAERATLSG